MSLGHWCFVCTVTCSLVFWRHWVQTCHCAEFRFFQLDWKSFKLKHLELFEFTERFFVSSKHWLGSLTTVELYYLHWPTVEHYGNCDCCNWWKDWATLSRDWPRVDWLSTGKIQPTGVKHTEGACTALWERHCHWVVGTDFGWVWSRGDPRLTVSHLSCYCCKDWLWDTETHCCEPRLASNNSCAWQHDWWTVRTSSLDSKSRQSLQLFLACSTALPQVPELASIEDCRDTVSKLQDAALLLHTGGIQLLWKLWTKHCGDLNRTGLQGWCSHHWSSCTEHVLCDHTDDCQGDPWHWDHPHLTVYQQPGQQLVHSQVCTASTFPDLLVWIHWLTVTARAYDTDSVQPCTSQVLDFNDCSSTDVQPCGRGEEGGGTHCL